jgi:hypothetical protein
MKVSKVGQPPGASRRRQNLQPFSLAVRGALVASVRTAAALASSANARSSSSVDVPFAAAAVAARLVDDDEELGRLAHMAGDVPPEAERIEHQLAVLDGADGNPASPFQVVDDDELGPTTRAVERAELVRAEPLAQVDAMLAVELALELANLRDAEGEVVGVLLVPLERIAFDVSGGR